MGRVGGLVKDGSAVRTMKVVVGRRGDVDDLIFVLDLVWGQVDETGLARQQVGQVHASLFSPMALYCFSVSAEQAL